VPYTGIDPAPLSLCLDKARTKEVLAHYGLPTPEFAVTSGGKRVAMPAPPVIVKPLHEGSSKGIRQTAFCRTRQALRDAVQRVVLEYAQPALVERWLPGREFTCAVLGNGDDATVLPIIELNFEALPAGSLPMYSYEAKWIWDSADRPLPIFQCPASIPRALAREIRGSVLAAYRVLRCRDWARIDVRCDARGRPHIIEVNPLPGVLPDPQQNSCFPKAARAAGMDYAAMIGAVLGAAAARYELAL
jgi:D-alanine-D-alanine ligase